MGNKSNKRGDFSFIEDKLLQESLCNLYNAITKTKKSLSI